MSVYGTIQTVTDELQRVEVVDYTFDGNVIKFPFALPSNSVIKEIVMYNQSNTEENVRLVRLVIEGRTFKYKDLETGNSYKLDVHVWKGGIVECKIYDSVVSKLAVFYTT